MGGAPLPELAVLLAGLLSVLLRGGPMTAVAVARTKHRSSRRRLPEIPEPIAAAISNTELINRWREALAEQGAASETVRGVRHGAQFVSYVKRRFRRHWSKATNGHLDAWLERTKTVKGPGGRRIDTGQPLADSTRHANEKAVLRLYAWTVTAGILRVNPFARRRPMRRPESPERYVPRTDIRHLLDTALDQGDHRMHVMISLIFWAGFRRGGIAAARLEDIRWHAQEIAVRGKGDGGAVSDWLPLAPELAEILAAWTAGRPKTGPLIPSLVKPGRHLGAAHVGQLISAFMHDNGVEESAHGIRHTAGKEIAAVEDNPRAAQGFLVHRSLQTTEKFYLKGAKAKVRRAVNGRPTIDQEFDVMGAIAHGSKPGSIPRLGARQHSEPAGVLREGHEPTRRRADRDGDAGSSS